MNGQVLPDLHPIEQMMERLQVSAVFGPANRQGALTIVPVAEVSFGFGFGFGGGEADDNAVAQRPGGGGAGAGGKATPRGYITIGDNAVTYTPILDSTQLGLSAMTLVGWSIFWVARTLRAILSRD